MDVYIHTYIHVRTHTCVETPIFELFLSHCGGTCVQWIQPVCIYVWMYVYCMYVCMYLRIYIYIYIIYVHI